MWDNFNIRKVALLSWPRLSLLKILQKILKLGEKNTESSLKRDRIILEISFRAGWIVKMSKPKNRQKQMIFFASLNYFLFFFWLLTLGSLLSLHPAYEPVHSKHFCCYSWLTDSPGRHPNTTTTNSRKPKASMNSKMPRSSLRAVSPPNLVLPAGLSPVWGPQATRPLGVS